MSNTYPVTPYITGEPEPSYDLKYLFEVTYRNGGTYLQNAHDVSAFDPARTPWYDVETERIQPLSEAATLALFDQDTHVFVDLADGSIAINGQRVWCCDTLGHLPPDARPQPYYKRRIRRVWDVVYDVASGLPQTRQCVGVFVQYLVGWDAIVEGVAHHARIAVE